MRLQIDKEQKEIKDHGSFEFPLRISHERLSWFDTESFPLHWHPEIELTLVLEGNMVYQVNDQVYHIKEGEGLFCNTNAMHAGWKEDTPDCHYLSVTFHPRILYGYGSSIFQIKYVNPILNNREETSLHFTRETPWMGEILEELKEILRLFEKKPDSAEMQMQICLLKIWTAMYENTKHEEDSQGSGRDTERIRSIIRYLQEHYQEAVTLEEVAEQVHLCKSESCRLFKRYMKETIFEYLLRYRVEKSLELLKNSSLNVTQVAAQAGFATPGYYTRIFREKMGCTPLQYRKKQEG